VFHAIAAAGRDRYGGPAIADDFMVDGNAADCRNGHGSHL
jgi:hypothetical protein